MAGLLGPSAFGAWGLRVFPSRVGSLTSQPAGHDVGPMAMGPRPSTLDPGKGSRDRGWMEVGARELRQVPAHVCFLREQTHETLFQSSQHTSP